MDKECSFSDSKVDDPATTNPTGNPVEPHATGNKVGWVRPDGASNPIEEPEPPTDRSGMGGEHKTSRTRAEMAPLRPEEGRDEKATGSGEAAARSSGQNPLSTGLTRLEVFLAVVAAAKLKY